MNPRSAQRSRVLPCALINTILLLDPPSCVSIHSSNPKTNGDELIFTDN